LGLAQTASPCGVRFSKKPVVFGVNPTSSALRTNT
jgi:hypothetical protein